MSQVYFARCSVFPGLVGQEFIFPACHRVSQREKRWLLKQHILPSTCLLPAEHVISHHNSGLLLQIQQSAWPGPREHSDRYQTRDGWHTTRTPTVSPFSLFYVSAWIPYKMQSQWRMLQVAEDCTSGWDMHLFACLARWQSLNSLNKTMSDSAATTKPSLCFLLQSCFLYEQWQCSIYTTSDAKMSKLTTALVNFNQVSVFMTFSEIHIHLGKIYKKKNPLIS